MPVLESIQNQEILALNGVPTELAFEVRWQVSLVLEDMHQGCVFVLSMVFQFALLRGSFFLESILQPPAP